MSIRLLSTLALFAGLIAFAPAPEAAPAEAVEVVSEAELFASAADEKCVWLSPTRFVCY
ncbi:MAG: hypothetical protein AAFQ43_01095 [Bacteroidota bacterium]